MKLKTSFLTLLEQLAGRSKNPALFVPAPGSRPDLFLGETRGEITFGRVEMVCPRQAHVKLFVIFSNHPNPPLLPELKNVFFLN
jgi:hypothetical protein